MQNKSSLNFFDPLIYRDETIFHTADVLGRGEKIWLLAKLPNNIRVGKTADPIKKYYGLLKKFSRRQLAHQCEDDVVTKFVDRI